MHISFLLDLIDIATSNKFKTKNDPLGGVVRIVEGLFFSQNLQFLGDIKTPLSFHSVWQPANDYGRG